LTEHSKAFVSYLGSTIRAIIIINHEKITKTVILLDARAFTMGGGFIY